MADIIIGYGGSDNEFSVVFLYPISTPKQLPGTSVNVVPTPSSSMPADHRIFLDSAEIAALDAGTLAFDIITFTRNTQRSNADIIADLKTKYDAALAAKAAWYTERYRFAGTRLNR